MGNTVILLMGPTAAGKTELALEMVERFNMEIISVDSAQIYKGMDIGTAKPDAETLRQVPHHLIDIRDPAVAYSAAEFASDAGSLIEAIRARGKTPLLCGGTMLYYRAITDGLSELPQADEEIRQSLEEEAQVKGWQAMHEQLRQIDPESAGRIHPNDPQRIQRALEIHRITGMSLTDWIQQSPPQGLPYDFRRLVISPADRSILHQRIESRFDQMLEAGFIDEVEGLRSRTDLDLDKPSMRCVGYRQIWESLEGKYSMAEARLKGIYATRQLAKRQLTWLRSMPNAEWFDPLKYIDSKRLIDEIFPNA